MVSKTLKYMLEKPVLTSLFNFLILSYFLKKLNLQSRVELRTLNASYSELFSTISYYCCLLKEDWTLKVALTFAMRGLVVYKLVPYKNNKCTTTNVKITIKIQYLLWVTGKIDSLIFESRKMFKGVHRSTTNKGDWRRKWDIISESKHKSMKLQIRLKASWKHI